MALVKCKECGSEISTKAAVCPRCGAKPRRTSGCAWLVLILFGLFIIPPMFSGLIGTSSSPEIHTAGPTVQEQELIRVKSERAAQVRRQNIDYFNTNREQIISSAKKALLEKDYQSALSQSQKYLVSNDKELEQINTQAKNELVAIQKEERTKQLAIQKEEKTKQLLDELKRVSTNEYEKNRDLYQQLLGLYPDNEVYRNQLSFYGGKIEEEKKKQIAAEAWNYQHSDYEMGKGRVHRAITDSVNMVSFDFPYRGPQRGTLLLRSHPKFGKDVILSIERGQFLVQSYEDAKALVRFDDGDPINFLVAGAEDHSTTAAFFRDYQGFVEKMLKAKRVRISVPVYQQGNPVFEFDVSGFDVDAYLEKKNKG